MMMDNYYTETSLIGPKFEYHSRPSAENIYKSIELALSKKTIPKRKYMLNKMHTRQGMDPEAALWSELEEENYREVS